MGHLLGTIRLFVYDFSRKFPTDKLEVFHLKELREDDD